MFPIIRGVKEVSIGHDELLLKCQVCEGHTLAEVMVFSKYYHFFWVPIFPFAKEAYIICNKCRVRRSGVPFEKDIITNYEEVKDRFRHPWYLYTGATIALTFFVAMIFAIIAE